MASNIPPKNLKTPNKSQHSIDRLLRWPEVETIVGISRSHAHQLAARGLFPKPYKLVPGGRASAWLESEINQWIDEKVGREQGKA